jgi:hypothetical protein
MTASLADYDALPYDRLPVPETAPDFLAALAHLHGLASAPPERARVLELGCAQGGNLMPLAARWPGAEFVGVDLSQAQIAEGKVFARAAGLHNLTLIHADLTTLQSASPGEAALTGTFDYIIAHGVYSWVPEAVQSALLTVCRGRLAPEGLAYVSYNVAQGWTDLLTLRTALQAADALDAAPAVRASAARARLAQIALRPDMQTPLLQREIAYLQGASLAYLFHEYLAPINQPQRFPGFVQMAARHGLRYAGEAGPRRARVHLESAWGLAAPARHSRWLEAEAGLDEELQSRFRRSLLIRDDADLWPQPPDAAALAGLAFRAQASCAEEIDFFAATSQTFVSATGEHYPVTHPFAKAALVILSQHAPAALTLAELQSAAAALVRAYGDPGAEAAAGWAEALLDLLALQVVDPVTGPVAVAGWPHRPRLTRLAQAQLETHDWPLTDASHRAVEIDPWSRALLARLDGQQDWPTHFTAWLDALEADGCDFDRAGMLSRRDALLTHFQALGVIDRVA